MQCLLAALAAGGVIFKEINIDRLSQRHVCRKWGLQVDVKWCSKINIESEVHMHQKCIVLNLMFMYCRCVQHLQVNALMRRNLQLQVLAKCQNIDAQNIL